MTRLLILKSPTLPLQVTCFKFKMDSLYNLVTSISAHCALDIWPQKLFQLQWWFVNPGSNSPEISLVQTKSARTDFHKSTNGWFINPENSLIQKYPPGTNVSGLTNHHCTYIGDRWCLPYLIKTLFWVVLTLVLVFSFPDIKICRKI